MQMRSWAVGLCTYRRWGPNEYCGSRFTQQRGQQPGTPVPLDEWARPEPELNICIQEIMSHETINPDKCVELELFFEMGHCAGIRNGVKERDSPSDMDFATEALRTC